MATFVDSELAGSAGFADTINDAPGITARIAACRITLEKADHAERVLALMGDFGVDEGRYATYHSWADRLPRDASLGQARHGGDMRLAVFHYPIEGWTDAVVLNVLQGLAAAVTLEEMARVSYAPLADVVRDIAPREKRHTDLGITGLTDSPPPRKAAPTRRRPSPTGAPASPTASAPSTPPGSRRSSASASATARTRRCSPTGPPASSRRSPPSASPEETPMTVDVTTRPRTLESYVGGQWVSGTGQGQTLLDAATGAPVARIDSSGIDFAAALAWGRDTVGPKLRKLSFHERALMLKALGQFLMANKEEFYAESLATGATRADGWIDIEGGAGTLLSYASKARRELPNARVLTDGDVEVLSRDAHLLRPAHPDPARRRRHPHQRLQLPGLGHAGEGRPHLHRRPPLHREAGQPDRLPDRARRPPHRRERHPPRGRHPAHRRLHRRPPRPRHRPGRRHLHRLRLDRPQAPQPARPSSRTPPASPWRPTASTPPSSAPTPPPARPEFDLFVKEVAREMTVKAGQKCTAIRRVIAPRAFTDALVAALGDRLAQDRPSATPSNEATRMGALASLDQRKEVRERIRELQQEAEIVAGNPDSVTVASGDPEKGAFLNPVVLYADNPLAKTAIHDVEAFGPVSTVMPYDDLDEAIALARRGKGSLVASVFTDDKAVAEEAVLGLAPFHGRVLIGNRLSAKTSTGHGSPLPVLVHGGPGRAGGGEEMGGIRGVKHYMQRTAVQGAPRLLSAVTGRWIEGADARPTAPTPSASPSPSSRSATSSSPPPAQVTLEDIEHFADFTGDTFYAHMDEAAAKANPFFDGRVAHGYLIVSFAAGLFVDPAPGPVLANYGVDNLALPHPGLPRRHPRRPPHLQGDQPALRRRARRGPLGLPGDQAGRQRSSPSTTSSPWSPGPGRRSRHDARRRSDRVAQHRCQVAAAWNVGAPRRDDPAAGEERPPGDLWDDPVGLGPVALAEGDRAVLVGHLPGTTASTSTTTASTAPKGRRPHRLRDVGQRAALRLARGEERRHGGDLAPVEPVERPARRGGERVVGRPVGAAADHLVRGFRIARHRPIDRGERLGRRDDQRPPVPREHRAERPVDGTA